jgi:hypothetical protein
MTPCARAPLYLKQLSEIRDKVAEEPGSHKSQAWRILFASTLGDKLFNVILNWVWVRALSSSPVMNKLPVLQQHPPHLVLGTAPTNFSGDNMLTANDLHDAFRFAAQQTHRQAFGLFAWRPEIEGAKFLQVLTDNPYFTLDQSVLRTAAKPG